jgi:hypothetical protein
MSNSSPLLIGVLPPLLREDPRQEGEDQVDAPGHHLHPRGWGAWHLPQV